MTGPFVHGIKGKKPVISVEQQQVELICGTVVSIIHATQLLTFITTILLSYSWWPLILYLLTAPGKKSITKRLILATFSAVFLICRNLSNSFMYPYDI